MRSGVFGTLLSVALLGLPPVAGADTMVGADPAEAASIAGPEPTTAPALEPGGALVTVPPSALDLRVGPLPLPAQVPPTGARAIDAGVAEHDGARQGGDRGLSFAFEVKPRAQAQSRAWTDDPDEPGLQDNLERLIDRSTLGLRGSYRF